MDVLLVTVIGAGAVALAVVTWILAAVGAWDFVKRLLGRAPKPATAEQMEAVENRLDELAANIAPPGSPPVDTTALAAAATGRTADLLEEAVDLQSHHQEREAIGVLLEAFRRDLEPEALAQLHLLIGNSSLHLSELEEAEGHYLQSLNSSREGGLRQSEATVLSNLGVIYAQQGDFGDAEQHFLDALDIQRDVDDRPGEANALGNLGIINAQQGDFVGAEHYFLDALAILRDVGDRLGEAQSLGNLGNAYLEQGDLRRSEQHFDEGISIHREIGNRLGEARALVNISNVFACRGELGRAEQRSRDALDIHRQIGSRLDEALALGSLGLLAAKRSDKGSTCRLLREAAPIFDEIGAGGPGPDLARDKLEEPGCEDEPADD